MDDLPFDAPVLLRSSEGSDLENLYGMDFARCRSGGSQGALGSVVLRRVGGNSVALQCFRNHRYLEVDASGECRFVAVGDAPLEDKHLFDVEMHVIPKTPNHLFFVSRATGKLLQCAQWGFVRCDDYDRQVPEAWAIVDPGVHTGQTGLGCFDPNEHGSNDENRRRYILELAKAGRTTTEIQEIVELMYPARAAK